MMVTEGQTFLFLCEKDGRPRHSGLTYNTMSLLEEG